MPSEPDWVRFTRMLRRNEEIVRNHLDNERKFDLVKKPKHYNTGKYETIDIIKDIAPHYEDGFTAHCVSNAIKYESRAPHKGHLIQDLEKAKAYLEFAIEHEKEKERERHAKTNIKAGKLMER